MRVTSNSAVSLSRRFLLFQANQGNPCSEDYELFLSQVDYKRLSEDLSKIVNMKGKISLGSFVAPVKRGGKYPTFLTCGSSTKKTL